MHDYVSQAVLKHGREACLIGRVSVGEIESAVIEAGGMTRPVPSTLSVRVPFATPEARRAKARHTPDGTIERPRPRIDSALVKALARAHRWQRMLESGECGSITELAAAKKIDRSYVCRVLRLTLLAPEIVEAIMDGRQPEGMSLPALMKAFRRSGRGSESGA